MADLNEETEALLVDRLTARIVALSGLDETVAREVAISAIPPYDLEGEQVILRDLTGAVVARVPEEALDPYGILESIDAGEPEAS